MRLSELAQLFAVARGMHIATEKKACPQNFGWGVLGEIFYELSIRTSTSVDAAMKRFGVQMVIIHESYSSIQKGGSLKETIHAVGQ